MAFTNVVGNADPFQFTTAPEANPVPFTVRVKPEPPAAAEDGLSELIAGPAAIVNGKKLLVKNSGDVAEMVAVPGAAIKSGVTCAVKVVLLTKLVASILASEPWLKNTSAPGAKYVPVTVIVNPAPPAATI